MDSGYIIYVVDTETTGLSAIENDVIEISARRFVMSDCNNTEQKTWYLKAMNPQTISDEALNINKHKREDILHLTKAGKEKYMLPEEAVSDIEKWIMTDEVSAMDRILVGQNIDFDIKALNALWSKLGCSNTFPFNLEKGARTLDTKMIATLIDVLMGKRRRYYNLGTLVKSFGVKKRTAHRAEDDVIMTSDLFVKMINPLIKSAKESFDDCYSNLDEE